MINEAKLLKWFEAMKAKGHSPKMKEDGSLDTFAFSVEMHNGPGCTICGWSTCYHCNDTDVIPECDVIEGTVTK